jgi:flagellar biosynthesis protein FliQ
MNDAQVLTIVTGALGMAAKLAMPALLTTLAIGTFISIIQTVTQIQEQTLTFVPKLIGVAVVVIVGGNWMLRELVGWVRTLWQSVPGLL